MATARKTTRKLPSRDTGPQTSPDAGALPSREPQQDRSRASYERMLAAAGKLMSATGSADFTLNDVARVGKVSIGSIYLRFDGKEELVHVVHARLLAEVERVQEEMLSRLLSKTTNLEEFMKMFVEEFAEMLARYASRLRPAMITAMSDERVSKMGAASYDRFADLVHEAALRFKDEFGLDEHEEAVEFSFRVIYSTLARYLGLGSSPEAAGQGDWKRIKANLSRMCTSYLLDAGA